MICPNCNRIILDNTTVCPNCNAIVSIGTPIINQNSENLDSKGRPKMIFNIIFAVWLIMTYATTGTGAFAILNSENILEFLIMLIPILIEILIITTSVSLICRKKYGFVAQYFINSIGLLLNISLFAVAIFIIFLFDGSASELDASLNLIVDIFAWIFALLALPNIGMHTAGLIYYTKNKEKYFTQR